MKETVLSFINYYIPLLVLHSKIKIYVREQYLLDNPMKFTFQTRYLHGEGNGSYERRIYQLIIFQ